MKTLIVYDSFFGNTQKAAEIIEKKLAAKGDVSLLNVKDFSPNNLEGVDLMVIGSPTRAFSASPNLKTALKGLKRGSLQGIKIAVFDTRMSLTEMKNGLLNFLVKLFGYAADTIEKMVKPKGGTPVGDSGGFIVTGSEGPLREGEEEIIANWADSLG